MKPDKTQISDLVTDLEKRHGDRLDFLKNEAVKFSRFIKALPAFRIVDPDPLLSIEHVGRVIVDGVLQVGHNYEKQVRKCVNRISDCRKAHSLSGFESLLKEQGISQLVGFNSEETERDMLDVVQFLSGQAIESYFDLREWLRPEGHRDSLLSDHSGLGRNTRTPFKIADKTADYFRLLVSHWDAVAVDKGIKLLLAQAQVVTLYSNRYSYKEKRAIVQLAALELECRPLDLDQSIYRFSVDGPGKSPTGTKTTKRENDSKYCMECGKRIPRQAKYCPECGIRQV
jgi:ribosomal protein L40E